MTAAQRLVAYVAAGVAAMLLCLVELSREATIESLDLATWVFLLFVGVAVGAARPSPEVALGAAWAAALTQLFGGIPLLATELVVAVVVFAAARWGRAVTVVLSGVSILVLPLIAVVWAESVGVSAGWSGYVLLDLLRSRSGDLHFSSGVIAAMGLFGVPWLAGLSLRFFARAREARAAQDTAERQAEQAEEIARLREEQNRLARDVHDVVGHSLAVILAQAEAAQFTEGADEGKLKQTLATIATSARASLQDVRLVLSADSGAAVLRDGGMESLVEGVRASGHQVELSDEGSARPLPPELEVVAYRVLQEMLTNAMRHGERDRPIRVARRWPGSVGGEESLCIEVENAVDRPADAGALPQGRGLDGMRRRLESVGGQLEVREDDDAEKFSVIAWLPVRGVRATHG